MPARQEKAGKPIEGRDRIDKPPQARRLETVAEPWPSPDKDQASMRAKLAGFCSTIPRCEDDAGLLDEAPHGRAAR